MRRRTIRLLMLGLGSALPACGGGGADARVLHPWFHQSAAVVDYPCDEVLGFGIALADVDGHGALDIVSATPRRRCSDGVSVPGMLILGNFGGGLFVGPPVDVPSWNPGPGGSTASGYDPVLADFDGDTLPDLAIRTGAELRVFRPTGFFTTVSSWAAISVRAGPSGGSAGLGDAMVSGDFDGDGDTDLVAYGGGGVSGTLTSMPNDGTGGFDSGRTRALATIPNGVDLATSDLNGDGALDLVLLAGDGADDGRIAVRYGDGTGDFVGEQVYDIAGVPSDLDLADVDGDGDTDVVVAVKHFDESAAAPPGAFHGRIVVLVRIASSPFPSPLASEYTLGATIVLAPQEDARNVLAADFDGDGDTDMACGSDPGDGSPTPRALTCVENLGGGVFAFLGGASSASRRFVVPGTPLSIVLRKGDFDGDGRLDIAWLGTREGAGSVRLRLLRNRTGD